MPPLLSSEDFPSRLLFELLRFIITVLKRKRLIALTGTPGIGKSVFYLYFYERFKSNNPSPKIVVASYSLDKVLNECKLWNPVTRADNLETQETMISDSEALYLIDGVPDKEANSKAQIIYFISPDEKWLDYMNKRKDYQELYMPPWTWKEIRDVNEALKLNLHENILHHRWQY